MNRSLLNPNWRRACTVYTRPFDWALIPSLFTRKFATTLAVTFPESGFRLTGDGSASRRFFYQGLISGGTLQPSVQNMHAAWRALAHMLASKDYAKALGDLVGIDVQGLTADAALCVYSPRCWLRPHTDRDIRILTQVIYLNEEWSAEWGGCLRLLRSERLNDPAVEILPVLNKSVVFLRSDRSWHAVMPVKQQSGRQRRSLLFHLTA
jgi:SM-20-related protein